MRRQETLIPAPNSSILATESLIIPLGQVDICVMNQVMINMTDQIEACIEVG